MVITQHTKFIDLLRRSLEQPLPGPEAQYRMAHVARRGHQQVPDTARKAAVLALLYPRHDNWHIVLIERVTHQDDHHSGQISLPGGRHESTDPDLATTALREAEEEVGVNGHRIELIGGLTDLYIPVSNYLVHPYVGFTEFPPKFVPEEREVNAILEVPFSLFLKKDTVRTRHLTINPQITLRDVPYYHVFDKMIWGATAMMLSELTEVVERSQR